MKSDLGDHSYRLKTEKILSVVLAILIGGIWWSGAWGSWSSIELSDYISDYLSTLKIAIFALGGLVGFRLFPKGLLWPSGIFVAIALAFNPFLPLKLDRENWVVIDFLACSAALWATRQIFKASKSMAPEEIEKLRLAEARAKVIDEALTNGTLDREKYEAFVKKVMGDRREP